MNLPNANIVANPDPTSIPGVWRGFGRTRAPAQTTGWPELDDVLAGGWPIAALSQLVSDAPGFGFSVMVPLLVRMTLEQRKVALIAPPYVPYAPALRDAGMDLNHLLWMTPRDRVDGLWAAEQLLRSSIYGAVVLWIPALEAPVERRLQLAAEAGRSIGLVAHTGYCPAHSIAAVRLNLAPSPFGISAEVARCRGTRAGATVVLQSYRPWLH